MKTLKEFSEYLYNFHKDPRYDSIESLCKKAEDYFCDGLNDVDEKAFISAKVKGITAADRKSYVVNWMKSKITEINKIAKDESDNDISATLNLYDILFHKNGKEKYHETLYSVQQGTDFYRMRRADEYQLYDRKGMFLISDDNEKLVGDYRFNPSGYACLYLASHLYLSWEECRRPDFDKVNFSRFRNTKKIDVLDVTIRQNLRYIGDFLMAYLTLLCSAKTTDTENHHFQYLMPHLLMKVLCQSQRNARKSGVPYVYGIKYLSSRRFDQKDFLFQDKKLSEAYVFPQHPHSDSEKICPKLSGLFRLTEPRTYFLYKTHSVNFSFNKTALTSDYFESLFYKLELQTKKDGLDRYDK